MTHRIGGDVDVSPSPDLKCTIALSDCILIDSSAGDQCYLVFANPAIHGEQGMFIHSKFRYPVWPPPFRLDYIGLFNSAVSVAAVHP